jgi:hypothetical protein
VPIAGAPIVHAIEKPELRKKGEYTQLQSHRIPVFQAQQSALQKILRGFFSPNNGRIQPSACLLIGPCDSGRQVFAATANGKQHVEVSTQSLVVL